MRLTFIFIFIYISLLNIHTYAIKVFKMLEDLDSVNKPTKARVTNFDLEELSEITICIRVYFYHFPVKTNHNLKWYPVLSSGVAGDILFSVVAFESGTERSKDVYQVIPEKIFQSKDVKNIVFSKKRFTIIR